MDGFTDKVALVTGAGRSLGREISQALASLEVSVAANDINPLALDETVSQILQSGGNAKAYVFDIAKRMPIEGMIAQVLEHFGRIDILVNQASVHPDEALLEMDEWEFHRTLDVNLAGPFFTMQQVGRMMQRLGGGSMVNLISLRTQGEFQKGHAAHLASQFGLAGLTQSAAEELALHHIRVNAVYHGEPRNDILPASYFDPAKLIHWRESHPQGVWGEHAGVVSLVLYLCSEDAATITGQIFAS